MKTRDMIGSFFRDVINHLDEQATNDLKKYLETGHLSSVAIQSNTEATFIARINHHKEAIDTKMVHHCK